ncbi:hypothetical protein CARUB_v10006319mg [Capsella rubella]|uniref:Uncharacterized protein n=1 Tax=Capsella rubella TaxID=81985 RepID=R0H001_9BRAS|nr:hypothetical protein CARUB_v10006319mg [Capsella rubella]
MGIICSIFSKLKPKLHNNEAILKGANSPPLLHDTASSPQLKDDVSLKHKTEKNLIEEDEGLSFVVESNWVFLFTDFIETYKFVYSDVIIEVAKTERVAWLEVVGKFEAEKLTPNSLYEVAFVVKLLDSAKGWGYRVNFKLVLPTRETKERRENMNMLEKNRWVEIPAGEFRTSPEPVSGKIEFSMFEVKSGQWKSGLTVKGVAIRPKN